MSGLRRDLTDTEQRIEERRARIEARLAGLRATWRDRIDPQALVLAGVALGVVLDQVVRYRQGRPVVYKVEPGESPRHAERKRTGHRLARAAHLLPLAHAAYHRIAAARESDDQSPRSNRRAAASRQRKGNGLLRH